MLLVPAPPMAPVAATLRAGRAQDDGLAVDLPGDLALPVAWTSVVTRGRRADRRRVAATSRPAERIRIALPSIRAGDARQVGRADVGLVGGAGDDAGRGAEIVAGDDEQVGRVDREAAHRRGGVAHRHVGAGGELVAPAGDPARVAAEHLISPSGVTRLAMPVTLIVPPCGSRLEKAARAERGAVGRGGQVEIGRG